MSQGKKNSQAKEVWKRLKKNKSAMIGLAILVMLTVSAIFANVIAPYPYDEQNLSELLKGPSAAHLFGTDNFGRDIFSRVLYGGRISLIVGLISVAIGCGVGGTLGAMAAYYGGRLDTVIMRIMDVMLAMPNLLLAIALSACLGPGLFNAILAVGISNIPTYARVVRASVMTVKTQEYVEAAHALGVKNRRIILKHIIPNALAPIIVQASLGVAGAILVAASLSFIGLGVQPPTPEWGSMLSAGREYIRNYWHMVTFPGLAIMLTICSLNLLGDGLRDALDPRLKR
ncbi:ABC transporter permease [Lacrimispora sp. 210928-DFI.3.58]|uniref:ABC transporter permease n=1 Tax=Lacrimispora sp. 210928-DFI.3.58 TaxID=2883214 RepID=UPI0015B73252|nr:ABC transporter permease [Lacrimispora sp. 210928-DFI.3.58]MCB7317580.1 ABC transporter permease [Lacrimispora sp. 210928-DFI.3.58]